MSAETHKWRQAPYYDFKRKGTEPIVNKVVNEEEAMQMLTFWERFRWRIMRHCIPIHGKNGEVDNFLSGFVGYVLDYEGGSIVVCPTCGKPTPVYPGCIGIPFGPATMCIWSKDGKKHDVGFNDYSPGLVDPESIRFTGGL